MASFNSFTISSQMLFPAVWTGSPSEDMKIINHVERICHRELSEGLFMDIEKQAGLSI